MRVVRSSAQVAKALGREVSALRALPELRTSQGRVLPRGKEISVYTAEIVPLLATDDDPVVVEP
jgi:hypothetical protein